MAITPAMTGMSGMSGMVSGGVAIPWYLSGGITAAKCEAAWQSKGVASLAASLVNLANPSVHDLTYTTAPTWSTEVGWTKGALSYLFSDIAPSTGYSLVIAYQLATSGYLCGVYDGATKDFFVLPKLNATDTQLKSGNKGYLGAPLTTSGVAGINGGDFWLGTTKVGTNATPTYTATLQFSIFALNTGDYSNFVVNGTIVTGCSIYNTKLSDTEMLAVINAINAL